MSTVLFIHGLRLQGGRFNYFTTSPVNYSDKWLSTDLSTLVPDYTDMIAVLDFPYHPQTHYWFDHHESGIGTEYIHKAKYQGIFNPKALSCCQLIYDAFVDLQQDEVMTRLVQEVNMIDAALYPNPVSIYEGVSFGIKFRLALLSKKSNGLYEELINLFTEDKTSLVKLTKYNVLPDILDYRYMKTKQKLEYSFAVFKDIVTIHNGLAIYDTVQYDKLFFDRYFAYYLDPDVKYTVYITKTSDKAFSVAVSRNPWMNESHRLVPVNEICMKYGGGGHPGAGGVYCKTYEDAQLIQKHIITYFVENNLI